MNDRIAAFIVPVATVLALLLNALGELQIPLTYDATLVLGAVALILAAASGAAAAMRPRVVRPIVLTLCVVVLLDTLLGLRGVVEGVVPGQRLGAGLVLMAVSGGVLAAVRKAGTHLSAALAIFLVVLAGSIVITRTPKAYAARTDSAEARDLSARWAEQGPFEDLPIVLHLVFDELMSSGAMTDDLPGGAETREAFQALAEKHRLTLFDSVYSRHFFSAIALPNLVSPAYEGHTDIDQVFLEQQQDFSANSYFDDLESRGYRTVVFQSALLNFCTSPAVDHCEVLDSFDPAGVADAALAARTSELLQVILRTYDPSYSSSVGRRLLGLAHEAGADVGVLGVADRFDVQKFPSWFGRFATFAASVPRGTHVFAHFLVPHAPYLLREDCSLGGVYDAGYYLSTRYPRSDLDDKRSEYYAAYLAQVRCVVDQLDMLLTAISRTDRYRDAIVLIHGDHGSRISAGNILEDFEDRDLVDNYATFFAVKSPASPPGLDCEQRALPDVFRAQVNPRVEQHDSGTRPLSVLVLSREAGSKVEVPMVPFGCASEDASEDADRSAAR